MAYIFMRDRNKKLNKKYLCLLENVAIVQGKIEHAHSTRFKNDGSRCTKISLMPQHTILGVSFSWKNESSGQKDGIYCGKEGVEGVGAADPSLVLDIGHIR